MFPHEHKTAFILDHSPVFASSCSEALEIDVVKGSKTPLCKSLWTCAVEASLEYHRIVTDLFPADHLIRFVISDSVGRVITEEWSEEAMTLEKVMSSFANVGPPDSKGDQTNACILNGVAMAVEALTRCSPKQQELTRSGVQVENRGRILVVTHLKQAEEITMIEQRVDELISDQNKLARSLQEGFLPLSHVELCVVNVHSNGGDELNLPVKPTMMKVSEILSSEVHSCPSGASLAFKMHSLVQKHYSLASTTVTGIPMKEEQNSSGSSANYDVELLHHKSAHEELEKTGLALDNGLFAKRDGYNTYTLRWCTPAAKSGSGSEVIYTTHAACRCTPVEVNSRPSACLTSFLLARRTVTLELPKKLASVRITSHMLTCHGNHIYIHGLSLGRSPVEDPPSICDSPSGRVTDYRLTHFADFMKECQLQPPDGPTASTERAKQHLQRLTTFWPMTLGESLLFTLSNRFEPLLSKLKKRQLPTDEATECKKVIMALMSMEKTKDPLTAAAQCPKFKATKRDELYTMLWSELESYIRNYSHFSPSHQSVLNCLLQYRGRPMETFVKLKEPEITQDQSKVNFPVDARVGKRRDSFVVMENPASPTSSSSVDQKRMKLETVLPQNDSNPSINLLDLVMKHYETKVAGRRDFDARVKAGGSSKVELYPDLMRKLDEELKRGGPGAASISTAGEKGSGK